MCYHGGYDMPSRMKTWYITVDNDHNKRVGFWKILAMTDKSAKNKARRLIPSHGCQVFAYADPSEIPTFNHQLYWGELKDKPRIKTRKPDDQ